MLAFLHGLPALVEERHSEGDDPAVRLAHPYVLGGLVAAAAGTAVLPHLSELIEFVLLGAAMGVALAFAFVAIGAALSEATTPATRGLAMGGYSTAIYLGVGLASIGLGPVMATWGYTVGFTLAGVLGAVGTLVAVALWGRPRP